MLEACISVNCPGYKKRRIARGVARGFGTTRRPLRGAPGRCRGRYRNVNKGQRAGASMSNNLAPFVKRAEACHLRYLCTFISARSPRSMHLKKGQHFASRSDLRHKH